MLIRKINTGRLNTAVLSILVCILFCLNASIAFSEANESNEASDVNETSEETLNEWQADGESQTESLFPPNTLDDQTGEPQPTDEPIRVGSVVTPSQSGYSVVGSQYSNSPVYTREEVLLYMNDDPAPNFELQSTTGAFVSLSQYLGQPVVLTFWTSLTSDSLNSLKQLASAQLFYPNVQVLTVNYLPDENYQWSENAFYDHINWINSYFSENQFLFPALLDINGDVYGMPSYRSDALPMTYFIDRNGTIRIPWSGQLTRDTLETLLSMMRALDN